MFALHAPLNFTHFLFILPSYCNFKFLIYFLFYLNFYILALFPFPLLIFPPPQMMSAGMIPSRRHSFQNIHPPPYNIKCLWPVYSGKVEVVEGGGTTLVKQELKEEEASEEHLVRRRNKLLQVATGIDRRYVDCTYI
jgi:hypothetical protein